MTESFLHRIARPAYAGLTRDAIPRRVTLREDAPSLLAQPSQLGVGAQRLEVRLDRVGEVLAEARHEDLGARGNVERSREMTRTTH